MKSAEPRAACLADHLAAMWVYPSAGSSVAALDGLTVVRKVALKAVRRVALSVNRWAVMLVVHLVGSLVDLTAKNWVGESVAL